jgi:hypothetical protein
MVNQLIQDPNKLPKEYSAERLLSEFNSLGLKKGVTTLKNLVKVNTDLGRIFANGSNIDESLIDAVKVKKLTQDVFMQGIHLLENTLEIAQQSSIGNLAELRAENDELLSELKGKTKDSSIYSIIKERLEKNQKNIDLIKRKSDRIDELLCNAGLSTDALREIALGLPELVKHKSKDEFDGVVHELNERIGFAQRVKAEYERQGL